MLMPVRSDMVTRVSEVMDTEVGDPRTSQSIMPSLFWISREDTVSVAGGHLFFLKLQ
jgi:hypothetical protein